MASRHSTCLNAAFLAPVSAARPKVHTPSKQLIRRPKLYVSYVGLILKWFWDLFAAFTAAAGSIVSAVLLLVLILVSRYDWVNFKMDLITNKLLCVTYGLTLLTNYCVWRLYTLPWANKRTFSTKYSLLITQKNALYRTPTNVGLVKMFDGVDS